MINFDFHEIALAVPLLAFSLSALVRRRPAAAICWAVPLVFVEESQGFTVAAIGLLLAVAAAYPRVLPGPVAAAGPSARGNRWRLDGATGVGAGLCLTAWGLLWSVLAITVIIPHFNPDHVYYFWKDGGVVGGSGHSFSVTALLSQPARGWPDKLVTVVLLLLPTGFAALGSPVALLALPSLALRFMSVNTAYWGTGWHYNATVMPVLFIAAAEAIGRWQRAPALTWPAAGDPGAAPGLRGWAAGLARASAARPGCADGLARHGGAMMAAVTVALAFQFPRQQPVAGVDLPARRARRRGERGDGRGTRRRDRADQPRPARAARRPHRHVLDRHPGQPAHPVRRLRQRRQRLQLAHTNVPAFIATLYPHDGYVQVFERDGVYVFRRG